MGDANPFKSPKMAKPPKVKPVAPIVTSEDSNVRSAVDAEKRRQASMQGRSSTSLLDPVEAKQDDKKDLLG